MVKSFLKICKKMSLSQECKRQSDNEDAIDVGRGKSETERERYEVVRRETSIDSRDTIKKIERNDQLCHVISGRLSELDELS